MPDIGASVLKPCRSVEQFMKKTALSALYSLPIIWEKGKGYSGLLHCEIYC